MALTKSYQYRQQAKIKFAGIDNTTPKFNVASNRALDECNYVLRDNVIQKRYGTKVAITFPKVSGYALKKNIGAITSLGWLNTNVDLMNVNHEPWNAIGSEQRDNSIAIGENDNGTIYDIWNIGEDVLIVHKGKLLYLVDLTQKNKVGVVVQWNNNYFTLPQNKVYGIVNDNILWLLTGEGYYAIGFFERKKVAVKTMWNEEYNQVIKEDSIKGVIPHSDYILLNWGSAHSQSSIGLDSKVGEDGIVVEGSNSGEKYSRITTEITDTETFFGVIPSSMLAYRPLTTIGIGWEYTPTAENPTPLIFNTQVVDNINMLTKWRRNKLVSCDDNTKASDTTNGIKWIYNLDSPIYSSDVSDYDRIKLKITFFKKLVVGSSSGKLNIDPSTFDNDEIVQQYNEAVKKVYGIYTRDKEPCRKNNNNGTYVLDDCKANGYYQDAEGKEKSLGIQLDEVPYDDRDPYYHKDDRDAIIAKLQPYEATITNLTTTTTTPIYITLGNITHEYYVRSTFIYDVYTNERIGQLDKVGDKNINGQVVFNQVIQNSASGVSNIEIEFPSEIDSAQRLDRINKCTFGYVYNDSLFASGNSEYSNYDWHSTQIDGTNGFNYISDLSVGTYGTSSNAIVGYSMISDGKLMVLKESSELEPSIYYRNYNFSTIQLSSDNSDYGFAESFRKQQTTSHQGGKSWYSVCNFNGDTLFVSDDNKLLGLDVKGITNDSTRVASSRSVYIDNSLKSIKDPYVFTCKDALYYCSDKYTYITYVNAPYEWFKIDLGSAITAHITIDGKEYIGTKDGKILTYTEGSFRDEREINVSNIDSDFIVNGYHFENEKSIGLALVTYDTIVFDDSTNHKLTYNLNENLANKVRNFDYIIFTNYAIEDKNRISRNLRKAPKPQYLAIDTITTNDVEKVFKKDSEGNILKDKTTGEFIVDDTATTNKTCTITFKNLTEQDCKYLADKIGVSIDDFKKNYTFDCTTKQIINCYYGEFRGDATFKKVSSFYDYSKICFIKITPVKSYYITAPFTAGTLQYRKTIFSYTYYNDYGIDNDVQLSVLNDSKQFDDMMSARKVGSEYSYSDFDYDYTILNKSIMPTTFTCYMPIVCDFWCGYLMSDKPVNSYLSGMEISYIVQGPSYAESFTQY